MMTLRGCGYGRGSGARCKMTRRLACGAYGVHRSMKTSPIDQQVIR